MWTLLIPLVLLMVAPVMESDSVHDHIGISISGVCMGSDTCPTYEDILAVFPDTSNQNWSGDFKYIDGIYQRDHQINQYHFEYYKSNNQYDVVWIDPPADIRKQIKMINIEVDLPAYKVLDSDKMIDGKVTWGHTRYVDTGCREATIEAYSWIYLTGDTMRYMQNNCDEEYTNFNSILDWKVHTKPTFWQQLQSMFAEALNLCGFKLCL